MKSNRISVPIVVSLVAAAVLSFGLSSYVNVRLGEIRREIERLNTLYRQIGRVWESPVDTWPRLQEGERNAEFTVAPKLKIKIPEPTGRPVLLMLVPLTKHQGLLTEKPASIFSTGNNGGGQLMVRILRNEELLALTELRSGLNTGGSHRIHVPPSSISLIDNSGITESLMYTVELKGNRNGYAGVDNVKLIAVEL